MKTNSETQDAASVVAQVREIANSILDPCAAGLRRRIGMDDLGLVEDVRVSEGLAGESRVEIAVRATEPGCMYMGYFEENLLERCAAAGIHATVTWGSSLTWEPSAMKARPRPWHEEDVNVGQ